MLIDSENLIARIDKCYQESAKTGLGLEPVMAIRDIKALISVMPTVDAVPVKHGRWGKINNPSYSPFDDSSEHLSICSNCAYSREQHDFLYCPNCGAKMDLEEHHD